IIIVFKIRNKAATVELVYTYEDIVWEFYSDFGIWKEAASIDITSLSNDEYPTCTYFMHYLEKVEQTIEEKRKGYLQKIKITMKPLTKQKRNNIHGKI
ncbi:VirB4 family type IV secretion system protein, partial [Enterococcus faecalis]